MAKYKYILTVIITLCTLITYAQPAQYTPMTASGYQMKRLKVDSTLHLPSFCGVPTLRGSSAKEGALAIDTCGGFLFIWTNENGWDTIGGSGGGSSTDTISLSNRINLKIDSLKRSNDSVYAWINGIAYFQYTDSIGGGGGDFWKTSGITTTTGNVTITNSNGIISFAGGEEDIATFSVTANNIYLGPVSGNLTLGNIESLTDTSTYKPLMISSGGIVKQSTYWVSGGGGGIDSLKRSSDSVYARKNGEFIFQFKDSVGGGSGSDTAKVVIAQVHNATATTLVKGEVVYLFGSTGNVASVKRANNKTDSTSSKTFGIVRRDIVSGGTGFITTQGQIEKLNLGSYTEGDVLWLDSIDGQFTKVKPQAPYHGVFLGVVERANNGNGLAYIKVQNGYELGEIHDVKLTSPINNQVLSYSDTQLVWKNRNITSLIDTTVFQRKSIQPYSLLANNTTATANVQALPFKDTSGTYTGTIAWNGTAPTSGNLSYRWTRIGKMVSINISLIYANAGSANTQVVVALPSDAPTPIKPAGLTSASNLLYPATTQINVTNQNTLTSNTMRGMLRSNSSNNGFEFFVNSASNAAINCFITCTYFTD